MFAESADCLISRTSCLQVPRTQSKCGVDVTRTHDVVVLLDVMKVKDCHMTTNNRRVSRWASVERSLDAKSLLHPYTNRWRSGCGSTTAYLYLPIRFRTALTSYHRVLTNNDNDWST